MPLRTVAIITKDLPALEGTGKSIRLMHWLAHLSGGYDMVYCLYLGKQVAPPANLGKNIQFIPIPLIKPLSIHAVWRRVAQGLLKPYKYNLYWFENLSSINKVKVAEVINKSDDILFFRLYLYPLLYSLKDLFNHKSVRIDLDDIDSVILNQIALAQWKQGHFKSWLETRIGLHYFHYYMKKMSGLAEILYCANPLDKDFLKRLYPETKIECFPNKANYQVLRFNQPTRETCLLFTGALNYFPNVDAIYFFIKSIWPEVLKHAPDTRLIIAGSKPYPCLKKLLSTATSCELIENPESMREVFARANMLVVPLRMGGGTRIKILQAFSYGIPVITTEVGISGIEVKEMETVLIRNDAAGFATAILDLIKDAELQHRMATKSYDLFSKKYFFLMPK